MSLLENLFENHAIKFEPPLSDDEFFQLCLRYDDMNFEMTKEGTIRMMTPSGNEGSEANAEIIHQLRAWWHTHKRGRVYDSNTLFILPDGSKKGPDAAYITAERLATIPRESLRAFAPVCPNFVIELLSATDSLVEAVDKMHDWIGNGVELGWLIDPYRREVYNYSAGTAGGVKAAANTSVDEVKGSGPVEGFVLDLTEVWRAYEP
jgi:Uma2 family endonuclease